MPAFWTAIAQVSFTTFTREGVKVRAVARQNLFFVIPYRTSVVEDVKEVDGFRRGEIVRSRVDGERRSQGSESGSFLVIRGGGRAGGRAGFAGEIQKYGEEGGGFPA
jgi:hypothetical protein